MNTTQLIEKLKAAESKLSLLNSLAHCDAGIYYHGFYWRLFVQYNNGMEYARDFDSLEEAAGYVETMFAGAAIAAGVEL